MADLTELYEEVVLDHHRRPRNRGRLEHASHRAEGSNPLCGDEIQLDLQLQEGIIRDVAFEGEGCAISTASASLMTEAIKGLSVAQATALAEQMIAMLTGDPTEAAVPPAELGKLAVFAGVRAYPARVKCATMAWHTLLAALAGSSRATLEEEA